MPSYANRKQSSHRPSVPGPGIVLSSEAERRAAHVRRAVAAIQPHLSSSLAIRAYSELFTLDGASPSTTTEPVEQKAAWAITSMYVLGRCLNTFDQATDPQDSERWFFRESISPKLSLCTQIPQAALHEFRTHLCEVSFDSAFVDLMPYILEPHGPGSRMSVMKDPDTHTARQRKRDKGVFYTPSDVAEYIASEVTSKHGGCPTELRALDPACGTGVFLRALLRIVHAHDPSIRHFDYATNCLFGIDISDLAVQSACFVLLYDCLEAGGLNSYSPFRAWRQLRANFSAEDALRVTIAGRPEQNWQFFPDGSPGFDIILGNPPYAAMGERPDIRKLSTKFESISVQGSVSDDLYPPFIEMMWRLANPEHHASAMVVPLSIAYHRGKQIAACRRAMRRIGGQWRCAFFDREPHALFGEDVKTRNAILFHIKNPLDVHQPYAAIYCTPMRKWTSRSRAELFGSISYTCVDHIDIAPGIPKLGGIVQAEATIALQQRAMWFKEFIARSFPAPLPDIFDDVNRPCLFIGSTAYNFINVIKPHPKPLLGPEPLTQNPLTCLVFADASTSNAAFALLSSKLAFWWWHVHCDGFHVPRWFLESIPFGPGAFTARQLETLSTLGEELWEAARKDPVLSLNGGRQSLAYRPFKCEQLRTAIDAVLIQAAGLSAELGPELQKFVHNTIAVGARDQRRSAPATAAPIAEEEEVAS
jgi:Eco57I restriction-modification methylase